MGRRSCLQAFLRREGQADRDRSAGQVDWPEVPDSRALRAVFTERADEGRIRPGVRDLGELHVMPAVLKHLTKALG